MIQAYKNFWSNITNFSGTANRPDFWWPAIINYVLGVIIIAIIQAIMGHPIQDIYSLADLNVDIISKIVAFIVWLGNWSLQVRRLHDTNRSGWWILIGFVPIIGFIWLFILNILPSKPNRWQ